MEEHEENASEETTETVEPKQAKKGNVLPLHGNERTMNLNPLILTNIQSSHYFKVNLYELKTYHEVIDEIYYKVSHLEPWEKGSRKTAGQTGMCGGVRGVGAGGIVSTAYCLLYKLFTLRLTRKQLNGLVNHADSPYIRALGFMYIRYTQPPADLYDWFDEYLEDAEEVDVKAGGGQVMTIGDMLRHFLTKLEWFSTLFPRIPVPIQQKIEKKVTERFPVQAQVRIKPGVAGMGGGGGAGGGAGNVVNQREIRHIPDSEVSFGEAEKYSRSGLIGRNNDRRNQDRSSYRERSPVSRNDRRERDGRDSRGGGAGGGGGGDRRERDRERGDRERYRDTHDRSRYDRRDRGRDRRDFADDLAREKDRQRNGGRSHGSSSSRHKYNNR